MQKEIVPYFPDEIFLKIFSLLSPNDLCSSVSLCCKRFYILAKDKRLWAKINKLSWPFYVIPSRLQKEKNMEKSYWIDRMNKEDRKVKKIASITTGGGLNFSQKRRTIFNSYISK